MAVSMFLQRISGKYEIAIGIGIQNQECGIYLGGSQEK